MSNFKLIKQFPKSINLGPGVLDIDKKGHASFFENDGGSGARLLAVMDRVQINFAAAHGIMLSGFENKGTDKSGNMKFIYQEWWLVYER